MVDIDTQRAQVEPSGRIDTFLQTRDRVARTVPGITNAAISVETPISGTEWAGSIRVLGGEQRPERESYASVNYVSSGWFSTLSIPLVAGRDIADSDRRRGRPVAVVNEAFRRKFFSRADPVGQRVTLTLGATIGDPLEIVGVVADSVYKDLREPAPPTIYPSFAQYDRGESVIASATLTVRTDGMQAAYVSGAVAAAIKDVSPRMTITFQSLTNQINASLSQERIIATLAGSFGTVALLIAALGLYGVTSHSVTRRSREFAIRTAMGATPKGLTRMVLQQVTGLLLLGIVAGGVLCLWLTRFIEATLLYGIEPQDPWVMIGGMAVLITVTGLAGWLPARRAARVDPLVALRYE